MRRACSMRKSSPGYPKPGRRQKPARFSQRTSYAGLFLRPSAAREERVGQLADGRERPGVPAEPQGLLQLRGSSSGARAISRSARRLARSARASLCSASSLIDRRRPCARRGCCRGGFAQLELQSPAILADLRFGPDFERADFGEPRAELHRDKPLLGLLAEADHGVQRRVQVQIGSSAANSTTSPSLSSVRVSELYSRNDTGLFATSCNVAAIDLERRRLPRRRAARGKRAANFPSPLRRCRCSRRAAVRRAPARRCRSSARKSSKPRRARPRDRDRDSRGSRDACRTSAPPRRRRGRAEFRE